jgi:hypothetical protein
VASSLALAVLAEASLQPHAHLPHGIRIILRFPSHKGPRELKPAAL